jgi:flagellar biosynthesis protein FlhF
MRIKKILADSMKEALAKVKQELGENAVILKTTKTPRKLFSLSSSDQIEVTAAIDENEPVPKTVTRPFAPLTPTEVGVYSRPKASPSKVAVSPEGKAAPQRNFENVVTLRQSPKKTILDIKEDVLELRELLRPPFAAGKKTNIGKFPGQWDKIFSRLIASGVEADIARQFIAAICDTGEASEHNVDKRLSDELRHFFPVSGPLKLKETGPLICAFVGPTGVGKTTTLAKLSAHYRINKNKSISILTADTYRIAAIEQIRTFAEIMDIRLQVVFSPDEVPDALAQCRHDDIVFVDTAGRSRLHSDHMNELRTFLDVMHPDEVHLVLSATTKDTDLADTIERYRQLGANRVLFTKFDETGMLGNVFNAVVKAHGVPVSYFTFGQCVPDDIELAQPGRFIKRLWKEKVA